jgi:ATPase subunit of ABC transporter with duplicated ATPase domains
VTIQLLDLGKSFGPRTLFEEVSVQLVAGARYGLVGANGAGKTTLLKILAGDEPATDGTVSIPKEARVGVLRQDRFLDGEARIVDLAMMGDKITWDLLEQRKAVEAKIESGDADEDTLHEHTEVEERLRLYEGHTLESRAGGVLAGLGIPAEIQKNPLRSLSGGFQLRVLLAQVLLGGPDVLMLDEPTNHLDILSIRWLEGFLQGYRGCAIIISHDRGFLDAVVTDVLDVDFETVTLYRGNYSAFEREKTERRERIEAELARKQEEIDHKQSFVDRFGAKATKAKQAQSRQKQIEKIEATMVDLKSSSRRAPRLKFVPERPSGRDVLTVKGITKSYGDNHVLKDVSLTIRRGERVGIIGANGLGKSTLLKILVERLEADAGEARWGHEARVSYFPQDHKELMPDARQKVVDYLWQFCSREGTAFVRGQLGLALFSGDDAEKKVGQLSGGEAARLLFARMAVEKPNVLILDEPTNHLDLESIEALSKALTSFEGTVIFVSHDRWFVTKVASRIVEVKADGIVDFPGTYEDYLARSGADHLDKAAVAQAAKDAKSGKTSTPPAAGPNRAPAVTLSWEEQKRRRNRARVLEKRRDELTRDIEQGEARLAAIQAEWADPGFIETSPPTRGPALTKEEKSVGADVEKLIAEWESVETELAAIGPV